MSQTTKKQIHLIGNAHLDPVWLWRWQEGYAEVRATFKSALDRMNEFPDFKFTSACSIYYQWIEQSDPAMFREIQQRVKEGRWCLVGGWLLQPDCNLPCGESFARHALIAQRYFKEKFGVYVSVGYNVDSFGHNGNLPKILKNSRMDSYVFMRPMPHEKELPASLFLWESSDGSAVKTYRLPQYYNIDQTPEANGPRTRVFGEIETMDEPTDLMAFYGVGNHGGGPTVALLNWMHENLSDAFVYSTPNEYFEAVKGAPLPTVTEDLQFHAKGCYSVNSEIKANNRKAENRLLNCEAFRVLSGQLCGTPYPKEELENAWRNVLFNQFHDVLGGCCIKEAYNDARLYHGESLAIAQRNTNFGLQQISWAIDTETGKTMPGSDELGVPVVVFNPLPYPVSAPVLLRQWNAGISLVTEPDGTPVPLQSVMADRTTWIPDNRLILCDLPAYGYKVFWLWREQPQANAQNPFTATGTSLSNGIAEIAFDETTGELISYKVRGAEQLTGSATRLIDETEYDTWAHDATAFNKVSDVCQKGSVTVFETGPVRGSVRTVQEIGNSRITRDYRLIAGSDRVEVTAQIDFADRHRMLKFAYSANVAEPAALTEIPFGFIQRPTDGTEHPAGSWLALTDGGNGGLGLASDSKYSFSAMNNELSLTVLRGAIYADHGGQRNEFCEYVDMGPHTFLYTLFPFAGCGQAVKVAGALNNPPELINETFHAGPLPQTFSGMEVSAENIAVTAIKQQEDGKGTILRLYETDNKDTEGSLSLFGKEIPVTLSHAAVKTLLVAPDGTVSETDFIEI